MRAATRAHEAATRLALGASRWRIVRQSIADASVLAFAGSVLGVLFAYWAVRGLVALAPANVPRLESVQFDGRTILFTGAVCASAAILVGLAPGLQASRFGWPRSLRRREPRDQLSSPAPGVRRGSSRARLRAAHVRRPGGRSFLNLLRIDLGFNPTRVLTVDVELQDVPVARHMSFYERLLERVRALPDVEAAAAVYQRPLEHAGIGTDGTILIEGKRTELQFRDWEKNPRVNLEAVTPGIARRWGRLSSGDAISLSPTPSKRRGLRLSASGWPGACGPAESDREANPGARHVAGRQRQSRCVGIDRRRRRDVRYRGLTDPRFDLYLPHTQSDLRVKHLMVRSSAAPSLLAGAIRVKARRLEPSVLVENVEMMGDIIRAATAAWRFSASALALLGVLALAWLCSVSMRPSVSRSSSGRARSASASQSEQCPDIRRLVLREGLGLRAGVALGVAISMSVVRIVSGLLFDVQRVDASTLTATAVILVATSALALGIPAWRASMRR